MSPLNFVFAQAESSSDLWADIVLFLQTKGMTFALNLVVAILIFVIGRIVAGILARVLASVVRRGKVDEMLVQFISTLAYALMMLFVVLAALDRLGIPTTSLAAVIAAAGLAVGLALQGSLSNFAAGVLIILFKPFRTGDYIEAGGAAGSVQEIHLFHTILKSPDNRRIIVPNSEISGGKITNYSAEATRRIDLVIGCGYNDDLRAVKQFLEETIANDERVLEDPAPVVAVDELADSSINFVVRPWVKSGDYWATKWDLTEKIKLGFDEKGFSIPFPQQDVHLHQMAAS